MTFGMSHGQVQQDQALNLLTSSPATATVPLMSPILDHNAALHLLGYLGLGTTWANEMNLLRILPLVQDRSLDLLTSSPPRYHYHECLLF